ncbi:interferon kappa [Erinaceus europaeus]|uniref:Interferon 1FA n=1 Tax=Erinaceus europaeus TaxID=9365 RepID=A0A1S3AA23_ERIEU|nr:interferon kappa [Erinaceus europaeus]CAB0000501.1 TPA: interferon 1FA [Erinaceus europaeus]
MSARPDLIRKCLWSSCLVYLFLTGIHSLDCSFLNIQLRRVTGQNARLMSSMKGPLRQECLKDINNFELPEEIFLCNQSKKWNIKVNFYEIYANAFRIFSQYTVKYSWEEECMQQILMELNLQLESLEQCLKEEKENDEIKHTEAKFPWKENLKLKRYFFRIQSYLRDKKYSDCAWKIVFVEIGRCFYHSLKLTRLSRKK